MSLADALLAAGAAASKTSEDKRLGIELNMIKQRLSRNEARSQWVEGATMAADVLTEGKARGHVEFLREAAATLPDIRFVLPPRCWKKDGKLLNESCCDTKNVGEQTSDNIEKHL